MNKYFSEIVKAIAPLVVVITLFVIAGKFGISKVSEVRNQIKDANQKENVLTTKLSVLKSFAQTETNSLGLVTTAFPGINPAIVSMAQLKNIATKNGVSLTSVKTASSNVDSFGLLFIPISFQVSGTREGIIMFLTDIENIAPITQISRVKMIENLGMTSADVATKTYWAPYPKTIPQVAETVTDLTVSEKQMIQTLGGLIQPDYLNIESAPAIVNQNPFGL